MKFGLKDIIEFIVKNLAYFGIIFSLFLIIYLLNNFSKIVFLLPGLLALMSCITWLAIRNKAELRNKILQSKIKFNFLLILYILIYIISIITIYCRTEYYERPIIYFILISIITGIIACQIFISSKKDAIVLIILIIFLGINIAWSQLCLFPTVLGIDPWYHQNFTIQIFTEHFIPNGTNYSNLPIFHIIIAITSILLNLDYKIATILSVSLTQIICDALSIYLIASYIFKNYKIGLLSSLLVIIANYHIYFVCWSVPNGFATIFIPLILYLLIKQLKNRNLGNLLIIFTLLVTIIITHSIASLFMLIVLVIYSVIIIMNTKLVRDDLHQNIIFLLVFFILTMISWWTYSTTLLMQLSRFALKGFNREIFYSTEKLWETSSYIHIIPIFEQIFNQFGMFLYFSIAIIGLFYLLSKQNKYYLTISIVGLIPLCIGFFSLIGGMGLIDDRWWFFAEIFLSISVSIAIFLFFSVFHAKKDLVNLLIIFFGFFILSFLFIMSPVANTDNNLISSHTIARMALTEPEIQSVNTLLLSNLISKDTGTDGYFQNRISLMYPKINLINIDQLLYFGDYSKSRINSYLIRKIIKDDTFYILNFYYRLNYDIIAKMDSLGLSKTYDSNSISLYIKS